MAGALKVILHRMAHLILHSFHEDNGAHFLDVNGEEAANGYGDVLAEYQALRTSAVVADLSMRGRICLTGADRVRFLHGQVTNDIKRLSPGEGCYAALVTNKGKLQSDLNVYCLESELLLDFEPGLTERVVQRLEKFIVADDVAIVDVSSLYGMLSVQGPKSDEVVRALELFEALLPRAGHSHRSKDDSMGEIYLMNQPRFGTTGFDLFVPVAILEVMAEKLVRAAGAVGGRLCGWQALETARIEAGIPRFGLDMDETNFPQECGIEGRAVSYGKGCYIGQEVLNRIHTMGHMNRSLHGLRLPDRLRSLPVKGDKLFIQEKEVGYVTSAIASPGSNANIALGYLRKEAAGPGTDLALRTATETIAARVVKLPFYSAESH